MTSTCDAHTRRRHQAEAKCARNALGGTADAACQTCSLPAASAELTSEWRSFCLASSLLASFSRSSATSAWLMPAGRVPARLLCICKRHLACNTQAARGTVHVCYQPSRQLPGPFGQATGLELLQGGGSTRCLPACRTGGGRATDPFTCLQVSPGRIASDGTCTAPSLEQWHLFT